jgi:hypothetical protein
MNNANAPKPEGAELWRITEDCSEKLNCAVYAAADSICAIAVASALR